MVQVSDATLHKDVCVFLVNSVQEDFLERLREMRVVPSAEEKAEFVHALVEGGRRRIRGPTSSSDYDTWLTQT